MAYTNDDDRFSKDRKGTRYSKQLHQKKNRKFHENKNLLNNEPNDKSKKNARRNKRYAAKQYAKKKASDIRESIDLNQSPLSMSESNYEHEVL